LLIVTALPKLLSTRANESYSTPRLKSDRLLELAHVLLSIGDHDPEQLVAMLRGVDSSDRMSVVPDGALWAVSLVKEMRAAVGEWRDRNHPRRRDDIDRQFALCRIAAGINWANKPISSAHQKAAFCYAGWAAREYIRIHQASAWTEIWRAKASKPDQQGATDADTELWNQLWQLAGGFSSRAGRYILVAESLGDSDLLRSLGHLPWSAVIDLDPASDTTGLFRHAASVLGTHRGIHTFNSVIPVADYTRGTSWMMAGGWAAKSEYFPEYNNWKYARLHLVREFVKRLSESTSPDPLHVIVLPGASLDRGAPMARVASIVGAIDEASAGRAGIYLLGRREIGERVSHLSHFPIDVGVFIRLVAATFGTQTAENLAQIPGPNGEQRTIPLEHLRAMQENFHVLHSNILNEPSDQPTEVGAFWRGSTPTWAELHAGCDIERSIYPDLARTVAERLALYRNQTVILSHTPGSGGTTAALRAAWNLRREHPTAVLRHYSQALGDRLRDLFHAAERPVLLVAEASDLTESAREDLYRYLAQNNCRVVLLYVRRVLGQPEGLFINDPMDEREAKAFSGIYSSLTDNVDRKKFLQLITTQQSHERYRVPFFYGLATFERDFAGVERYVGNHLSQIRRTARNMLEYLALVTIFSDAGINESLLKVLTGNSTRQKLSLVDLFGEGPARLLSSRPGGYRLLHQIIAEHVLAYFQGGNDGWHVGLAALATDFIRDTVHAAGPEAMRDLFRQMFVDRPGYGEDVEDRQDFSQLIETLDTIGKNVGHIVLQTLTQHCPMEPHFWTHLGRYQVYRLRRDYDRAEEYLQRAISLSPNDAIHHHTYGLVLRSRLRENLSAAAKSNTLAAVFGAIEPYFSRAAAEFDESRRLKPDDIHGYITHVQMILDVARRLKFAANAPSVADVGLNERDVLEWLQQHLATAEELLREATHLYGTLEQTNTYLVSCNAMLDELYGDLDRVVHIWEIANEGIASSPSGRRALANAYLARRGRRWSLLDESELQRIVQLMEDNLRGAGRRDEDYRLWFLAYRLLPTFDVNEALAQLSLWARRFPSWRAYYYSYVLNFLLWLEGRTDSTQDFEEALEQCQKRHVGRKTASDLWYGRSSNELHLVSEDDLGDWDRDIDFWHSSENLTRINGMIEDTIPGPQAGHIRIDGRVRAFFVPGRHFSPNRDENQPTSFLLGFSPAGLRAWSVKRGHEGVNRRRATDAKLAHSPVVVPAPAVSEETKRARIEAILLQNVMRFIDELVSARAQVAAPISISELSSRVDSAFGVKDVLRVIGIDDIAKVLRETGGYVLSSSDDEMLVSPHTVGKGRSSEIRSHDTSLTFGQIRTYNVSNAYGFIRMMQLPPGEADQRNSVWFHRDSVLPTDRRKLGTGRPLVGFHLSKNDKGYIANGVRIVSVPLIGPNGPVKEDDVQQTVISFIATLFERQREMPIQELAHILQATFASDGPLLTKLNVRTYSALVTLTEGLKVVGRNPNLVVRRSDQREIGRMAGLPLAPQEKTVPDRDAHADTRKKGSINAANPPPLGVKKKKKTSFKLVTAKALELVQQSDRTGEDMILTSLGDELARLFPGEGKLARRLGYGNLTALVGDIEQLQIVAIDGRQVVRSRQHRIVESAERERPTFDSVREVILEVVNDAYRKSKVVTANDIGTLLARLYPGRRKVHAVLRYRSLVGLLGHIPEISVEGVGPNQPIRLRSKPLDPSDQS
jgi:tetratricopeptide (TPR) repeat protein